MSGGKQGGARPRFVIVLTALLLGVGLWFFYARDFILVLSQPQLQAQLDGAFPIEKDILGAVRLTLTHPVLDLRAGSDLVRLSVDARADLLGGVWQTGGTGDISGRPRYVPDRREMYLDDAHVDRLDIRGVPGQDAGPVRAAADLAARGYFDSHPVYRWRRPLLPGLLSGMTVKSTVIEDGALKITLGRSR